MRNFALALFMVCCSTSIYAQHFKGGLLAGFNGSQVDGDTYAGYDKLGLLGGVFVYTKISDMVDIQFEIKYMGKGARKKTTENDLTQYKSKLNYVEFPILVKINTKAKIGLAGGLGFGYLFSYIEEDEYGKLASDRSTKFKPFELSSIIGLNYQFARKFSVDLRYSYSILSLVDKPNVSYTYYRAGGGAYNNVLSMGIYYSIGQ